MYKLNKRQGEIVSVTRLADGTSFPLSEDNTDYIAYLKWVAEGNTPTPADEGTQ